MRLLLLLVRLGPFITALFIRTKKRDKIINLFVADMSLMSRLNK